MAVLQPARPRFAQSGSQQFSRFSGGYSRKAGSRGVLESMLIMLFLATFGAISFEDTLLKRRVLIDPTDTQAAARYSYSDEGIGGSSLVQMHHSHALAGVCDLRSGYAYPFCGIGMLLNVGRPEQGINLSSAEEFTLDVSYQGPGALVSLTLKNFDPAYSQAGRGETDKMNQVSVPVRVGRQTISIRPEQFQVAEWWIQQRDVPEHLAHRQLDNVVAVEIQTGAHVPIGRHRFQIHGIVVTTRVFTALQLYSLLAILWTLAVALLIIQRRARSERVQREFAEQGRRVLDAIPQMVWAIDEQGNEYFNRQWTVFTGIELGGAGEIKRLDLVHPQDRDRAADRWKQSLATGEPYECEYRLLHRSGEHRWVLSRGSPEVDEKGAAGCWYGTCTDIHAKVLASRALDASERLTRGIVSAIPDCVSLLDSAGRQIFVNEATVCAYGAAGPDELVGESWPDNFPSELRGSAAEQLEKARRGEIGRLTVWGIDHKWWDMLISPVCDGAGKVIRILVISRDITDQKAAEEQATWTAKHDGLTKLPNRAFLHRRLERLTNDPNTVKSPFALVLLDLDDFKKINDSAGHDAGDAVLCTFAERLQAVVRAGDTVARLSGDEFALLLPSTGSERELKTLLERVTAELRKPCTHAGRVFDCGASIGAGIFHKHGITTGELFKNVDVALYAAKAAGKGTFKIFRPALRDQMLKRSAMLSLARDAVDERRIVPYYQPKVDLRTGRIVGFEALLRWRGSDRGIQMPARIAGAFEDLTLAAEISDQIVDGVIHDLVLWRDRGVDVGNVAVNSSAAEFRRGDFAERLLERLHRASLPVEAMQLEVTETVFLGRGAECVERALETLNSAGMKIALDDFGTGYASLSHLNQFRVNILKIDRSFVRDLREETTSAPIIEAVINLGRSLGFDVVAEGIETELQHRFLRAAGCDQGQGYLYSPAVAARRVPALLQGRSNSVKLAA